MLSNSYYGNFSTAVATCGSQLNRFQINLLVKKLGVTEITLAFDKEYDKPYSEEGKKYRQKLLINVKNIKVLQPFIIFLTNTGF